MSRAPASTWTAGVREHPSVVAVVGKLAANHPAFAALWSRRDVPAACSSRRDVRHPDVGELGFDVQLLDAGGGDLQLVVMEPRGADRRRWVAHLDGPGRTGHRLRLA